MCQESRSVHKQMDRQAYADVLITWHLHLAYLEKNFNRKEMSNLIGSFCQEIKQLCNVEISQSPNQLNSSVASSSIWRQMLVRRTKSSQPNVRRTESRFSTLAWLLRSRTHGGVCSSVAYVKSLGSLNYQKCYYTGWRLCLKTFMPFCAWHCAETVYSTKKEFICICCMYKIFVCTKFYVQKTFVCTIIFYLIFQKSFPFMLAFL